MELSEEMIKRIFALFGNDNEVGKFVAAGDIITLWSYVRAEAKKCRIPFLNSSDIVQACENLNFRKLEDLYFIANYHLNNKSPLNIEKQIGFYKQSYPDCSEDDIKSFVESLKQDEFQEKLFLNEVVEAFRNLNLQEIYIKAKRAEEVMSLSGDLARLQRSLMQKAEDNAESFGKKSV